MLRKKISLCLYFIENRMVIIQSPEDGSLCDTALVVVVGGGVIPTKTALSKMTLAEKCSRGPSLRLRLPGGSFGHSVLGLQDPRASSHLIFFFFLAERAANVGNRRFAQPEANGLAKSIDLPEAPAPKEYLITS